MKKIFVFPLVIGLLFFSHALASDKTDELFEMGLDDLLKLDVTAASKKAERINDAPGIITIISRQEIEGFAARNLGQILNRVAGAQFLSPDVFVDQSMVIRGQEMTPYNNHVLILLNGRPVRDPISGGLNATLYTSFPIDIIDHIEIIRGPGSVLYGSCAYSGIVNIKTKVRDNDGTEGKVAIGAGSYEGFGQYADGGFRQGDLSGYIGLQHFKDDGPRYSFTDYNGTYGSDEFQRESSGVVANFSYKGFTFNGLYTNIDPYSLNGGSEYWDPGYKNEQTAIFADGGYNHTFNGIFSLEANFTYNQHRWNGDEGSISGGDPTETEADSKLIEVVGKINPMDKLNILLGGGYEATDWEGDKLHDGDQNSYFLYTQVDYTFVSWLKVFGGVQYNEIENIDGKFSPRVGVISNITDNFGAKLMYSEAFRRGYPLETSFAVRVFRGNENLEPETISTYEAQLFYNTDKFQTALTYFNSKMENIITRERFSDPTLSPPFYLQYLNGGSWDFQGLEFEGKYRIIKSLFGTGSVSYQTNENDDGITDAALHPDWMVKLGLLYNTPKFSIGVFDSYFGQPEETTLVRSDSAVVNSIPDDYHLLSAKISFDIFKIFNYPNKIRPGLSIEGDNLLDEDIRYPDYPNKGVNSLIPLSAGRTWFVKLSVAF